MRNEKSHKNTEEDLIMSRPEKIDVHNMVTPSIKKGSGVQQESSNVKYVINLATSIACATRKERNMITIKGPLVHPRHII